MSIEDEAAAAVAVLREQGPLTLIELTKQTAIRLGHSILYMDVYGRMLREQKAGRVVVAEAGVDYREWIWRAT
jgi:hypothetical protein